MSQDIKENMISQQETKEQFQLLEDLERFKSQSYQAATEILQAGKVKPGQLFVVGCSTSEVCGGKIGTASSPKAAQAVFEGIWKAAKEKGVWLAAQCCEHLNRALILEQEAADQYGYEEVNVVPQPKAGGSFATAAYHAFSHPVGYWRYTHWDASKRCRGSCENCCKSNRGSPCGMRQNQTEICRR